ncbi:MAG: tetratricopeptide repeat protein [Elusimicrobia bacterium]|nr:tetratricopeptide repeat protein [Elusimicrobiota bacterium]
MRKLCFAFLLALAACPAASAADGMDASVMEKQDSTRREMETKIKTEILDPILGPARSFVFADIEMELISKNAWQTKEGLGVVRDYKGKGSVSAEEADFLMADIASPRPDGGKGGARPGASLGHQAQQGRGVKEVRYGLGTEITRFQLTVLHDDRLPQESLKLARERLDGFLLQYKVRGTAAPVVIFKPTRFRGGSVLDDMKRPGVYLPLVYAALFLLLLAFLFGPLRDFFRKYAQALLAGTGAAGRRAEEGAAAEGAGAPEGRQLPGLGPEQEGEEEDMKQVKPFAYLTEENLKRLIYYFLLKKEDPWVIALVLNYIRPDLAGQALTMLSAEVQAKVALESLAVRQATRAQIEAIDKEIKENVDFVTGGIERLTKMLEETDVAIRKNILDYLKAQKPEIYEKVRKAILAFEDLLEFSDKDMQTVIRSVSNEDIARVVYKAEPALQQKFFSNMSQGAAEVVREIMDYQGDVSRPQAEEARMKIIGAVKRLEDEGRITPRQPTREICLIDGEELFPGEQRGSKESAAGEPAPAPAAAEYFSAGVEFFNQGRVQESLQYLEYASALDPRDAGVWQYLGGAYYALQRVDEAVAAYARYAALSGDPAAGEWLAGFRQRAGR